MKKSRILIVEDNQEISERLKKVLLKFGYEVTGVLSFAEDAVDMVKTIYTDLILMDIDLAGEMNGIEASRLIKEDMDIPIIYLTANNDADIVKEATKTNPYAYLLKPFDESELRVNIEMSIYRHKSLSEEKVYHKNIEELHKTAVLLMLSDSENEIIDFTVKATQQLCHFDQYAIYKKHFSGLDYIAGSFPSSINNNDFRFSKDFAELTFEEARTYHITDYAEFPIKSEAPVKFKSSISITIGTLGVFQIFSKIRNAYTNYDVKILELLVGHMNETMKRVSLEREFREQAVRDHLTGCYNRFQLYIVMDDIKKRIKNNQLHIGLVMIDINNLKQINDSKGHQAGDEAIKIVASIITKEIKKSDYVFRYGGDEFLLILDNFDGDLDKLEQRIQQRMLSWNKNVSDLNFAINFAMGGLIWDSKERKTLEEALAEVDKLMYINKKQSKKRRLFSGKINGR